ncbi:MAG: hypothetical protein IJ955_09260 [Oscillospiraceae bacterium]|nr:hypothetical protein [Oscillospiraceae bacterium]
MNASLVIMAAGLGSRYGGDKQIDGVGPNGEFLMEYAIHDAVAAGFNKVIFIIKPGMEDLIRRMCGDSLKRRILPDGKPLEVVYAFQDFSSIPEFYNIPKERTKPFGTVHAVLCAESVIHEPFCVLNADDYYGADAYKTIFDELKRMPEDGFATMVAYQLKNTASIHGTVSRGICEVENDALKAVHETKRIQLYEDGILKNLDNNATLDPEVLVSMNFWGFTSKIFPMMRAYFYDFLRSDTEMNLKSECLLPVMVDDLMQQNKLTVSVLHSCAKWFGMTYQEDKALVAKELKQLHQQGVYPANLRG